MLLTFEHLFLQESFADADVVLLACEGGKAASARDAAASARDAAAPDQGQEVVEPAAVELRRVPGHMALLSKCPYFKSQAERWPQQQHTAPEEQPQQEQTRTLRSSKRQKHTHDQQPAAAATGGSARRTVTLTLTDARQEPAAMAVLAALYGAKSDAQLLDELTQEQQVDVVLLADMLQLPGVAKPVVESLAAAVGTAAGLTEAVVQQFLALPAVPHCLVPLLGGVLAAALKRPEVFSQAAVRARLLGALGDLEAAWADAQLKQALLGLPLPVMELLLSCNELQVTSEDTVLYTTQAYVDAQPAGAPRTAAAEALSKLVRCPQLSQYWLAAMTLSRNASNLLLAPLTEQLKHLLLVRAATASTTTAADMEDIADAPASWLLPPRAIRPLPDGVWLQWQLPVSELEALCRRAKERQATQDLLSLAHTAPLDGLAWQVELQAEWDAAAGGVKLGLFVCAVSPPAGTFLTFEARLSVGGDVRHLKSPAMQSSSRYGCNFFRLGAMVQGWDAAAWAAKGLPATGELCVGLCVTSVNGS